MQIIIKFKRVNKLKIKNSHPILLSPILVTNIQFKHYKNIGQLKRSILILLLSCPKRNNLIYILKSKTKHLPPLSSILYKKNYLKI